MDAQSLAVFAIALTLAAATPGPGIIALVARVLGRGRRGAAAFGLGACLADLVWLGFAVGGLAVIAQTFHWLFLAIKWGGIAYLLWLAWRMWNAPAHSPGGFSDTARSSHRSMALAGFSLTMGNPKVMMFYMALLPSILDLREIGFAGYLQLCAVVAMVLATVFSSYILLADRARGLLTSAVRVRTLNRGAALTMSGAAGWVASH